MEDLTITRQEVCNLMKSLKEDKSPGVDNVHPKPKVLSRCHETLSHPLQLIFSQSLLEGKLPQQWKDANVTPLHKKGPKSEVGNYRPVSLTSIPCKLLETIIRSRIVQYLEQNNLLTLWNPRATTVDSPPDHGRPESTQEFIIIVYLRLRVRMRYAWTSHLAIDINTHTRIGVCLTYNIAFE